MFSEIHDYYEKVKEEIEAKAEAAIQAVTGDLPKLATDVNDAIGQVKAEALKEVATAAPDIQAAVQKTLGLMEQAILAAIAAHVA